MIIPLYHWVLGAPCFRTRVLVGSFGWFKMICLRVSISCPSYRTIPGWVVSFPLRNNRSISVAWIHCSSILWAWRSGREDNHGWKYRAEVCFMWIWLCTIYTLYVCMNVYPWHLSCVTPYHLTTDPGFQENGPFWAQCPKSERTGMGPGPGSKWSIPPNHSISFNDTKWRISSWNIGTTLLDPQMFAIVPSPPTGGRPGLTGPEAWTKSSPSTAPTTWSPESAWWNRGTSWNLDRGPDFCSPVEVEAG